MYCVLWSKQWIDLIFHLSTHCLAHHSPNCFLRLFFKTLPKLFICSNTLPKLLFKIIFIIETEAESVSAWNQTTSEISVPWHSTIIRSKSYRGEKMVSESLIPSFPCIWVFPRDGKLRNFCALIIYYCKIH